MPDGVLGHLDEDRLTRLQGVLDPLGGTGLHARCVPVDLTGIQDGVAATPDIDEGGLHGGQDILDLAEVDVPRHRRVGLAGDVVLDEDVVLEDADLGAAFLGPHDHDPLDALAAGEELSLGDDLTATPSLAALATTLLLGLQTGRTPDTDDLVAGGADLADASDHAGSIFDLAGAGPTTAPTRAAAAGQVAADVGVTVALVAGSVSRPAGRRGVWCVASCGCRCGRGTLARGARAVGQATATALATPAPTPTGGGAGGVVDGVIGIGIGQDVSVGGADLDVVCLRLVGRDQGVLGSSVSGRNRKRGSSARPGRTTTGSDDDRGLKEQSEARHRGRPGCFLRFRRLGGGCGCLHVEGRVAGLSDRRGCRSLCSGRCGGLARSPLARGPGRGSGRSGPARDLVS